MKKWIYLLAASIALEAVSAAFYLNSSHQAGFPLDDAWIHQTYARNLGLHGLMAFSPGIPSTGSTSAGWTALLAAGYFLNIPFHSWANLWGCIFAVASAFTAAHLSFSYFGSFRNSAIVAVLCIFEWHLAWSAVSGMESSFFIFLSLLFLLLLYRNSPPYLMGLVAGLAFLVRPEAFILIAIYGVKILVENRRNLSRLLTTSAIFLGVLLIIVSPWMIFNYSLNGRPFPSTISSKFMQYGYPFSIWKSVGYIWNVFLYFWNGPLMLLVPCAGFAIYTTIRHKRTALYYAFAWSLSLILIYAVAIPAIYHHGRYLMPLIPLLAILGVEGLTMLFEKFQLSQRLRTAVWLVVGGMTIVLWFNGASTYALQVKLLNANHAQVARWVDDNTPKDAIIATHDIGLVGYITQRQLVDLAGLVTPKVIPIMNDHAKLADFVRGQDVTYVIVFTGYYKDFLERLNAQTVYSPGGYDLNALGLEPFEVFQIPNP
ncbi:MAG TPA: hypothetical protein VJ785_09670 [Anaerolineales bacterium]|nr:hypothetical protein [Anaerolineales bacterium]